MFKKMISIVAVVGLALALAPAVASADVIDGVGMPDSYRIAFTTSTTTQGTSSVMTYYNDFVDDLAKTASSVVKDIPVEWYCIGSVSGGIDAKHNTNTLIDGDTGYDSSANVPIYILDGTLLAASNEALWNGTSEYKINRDETAASITIGIFTGTTRYGANYAGASLGDSSVRRGSTSGTASNPHYWIEGSGNSTATLYKGLFALSAPIPEPATMTLLAIGGFGVLLKRRRRRV